MAPTAKTNTPDVLSIITLNTFGILVVEILYGQNMNNNKQTQHR